MPSKKSTEPKTLTRQDQYGNDVEVPVGIDGVSPVSPGNPALKAVNAADRDAYQDIDPEDLPRVHGEPETGATLPEPQEDTSADSASAQNTTPATNK